MAVYGGIYDLFKVLKEKSIRELSFPPTRWDLEAVANTGIANDIVFPLIDWSSEDNSNTAFPPMGEEEDVYTVKAEYLFPCVKLSHLLAKIFEENHYSYHLPKTVLHDPKFYNAVIPVTSVNLSDDEKQLAKAGVAYGGKQSLGESRHFFRFYTVNGNFKTDNNIDVFFKVKVTGTYHFKCKATISSVRAGLRLSCHAPSQTLKNHIHENGKQEIAVALDLVKGDEVKLNVGASNTNYGPTVDYCELSCELAEFSGFMFPSVAFDLASNLPDLKQSDILIAIAQLWCLTVEVDEAKKVVEFYTFGEPAENIRNGSYYDWSGTSHWLLPLFDML